MTAAGFAISFEEAVNMNNKYFASSEGDVGMVLWQLERAKKALMVDV
jgi:hypothetical protein